MELIQKTFSFDAVSVKLAKRSVRMVGTPNSPWFCGKDVAVILGYKNISDTIRRHVDIDDKTTFEAIFEGSDFTTPQNNRLSKTTYINESGLYSLILRSKLKTAKKFKKWVTSEVLPSIRKSGQYKINQEMEQMRLQIEEQSRRLNHANIVNRELLDFKLMVSKSETVYVMSSKSYAKQGLWKIGRTKQKVTKRLSSANTSCPAGENIFVLKTIKTHSAVELEKRCHWILKNLRPTYTKEWFLATWTRMSKLLDIISENMDKEIDIVNELVKEVHSFENASKEENSLNKYIEGLDMSLFTKKPKSKKKETLTITHVEEGEEKKTTQVSQTINISSLTNEQKKEKLKIAINKFVRNNVNGMEEFDYETQKDSPSLLITLKWKNILQNLMEICDIQNKSKIKANSWKPSLKEIERNAKCISNIKWR